MQSQANDKFERPEREMPRSALEWVESYADAKVIQ